MSPLHRALDALEALLDALPQSGPGPRDIDIEWDDLPGAIQNARALLYESGRLVP